MHRPGVLSSTVTPLVEASRHEVQLAVAVQVGDRQREATEVVHAAYRVVEALVEAAVAAVEEDGYEAGVVVHPFARNGQVWCPVAVQVACRERLDGFQVPERVTNEAVGSGRAA